MTEVFNRKGSKDDNYLLVPNIMLLGLQVAVKWQRHLHHDFNGLEIKYTQSHYNTRTHTVYKNGCLNAHEHDNSFLYRDQHVI